MLCTRPDTAVLADRFQRPRLNLDSADMTPSNAYDFCTPNSAFPNSIRIAKPTTQLPLSPAVSLFPRLYKAEIQSCAPLRQLLLS